MRLASRFCELNALGQASAHCSVLVLPVPDAVTGLSLQGVPQVEDPAEDPVGRGLGEMWEGEEPVQVRGLLSDGRCSQAVLDFLSTTDVGRLAPTGEDAGSEVSEREIRERREGKEERRTEAEELGAAGKCRRFYPRPPSWHPQTRTMGVLAFFFRTLFLCDSFSTHRMHHPGAEGKGELEPATCRPPARTADCGRETWMERCAAVV